MISRMMNAPGARMFHHAKLLKAPFSYAVSSMVPQLMTLGSPRPKKSRNDSENIEFATSRIVLANIRGKTFGRICLDMILPLPAPTEIARSTNVFSLIDSTWARTILEVDGQLVMPMTMITFVKE